MIDCRLILLTRIIVGNRFISLFTYSCGVLCSICAYMYTVDCIIYDYNTSRYVAMSRYTYTVIIIIITYSVQVNKTLCLVISLCIDKVDLLAHIKLLINTLIRNSSYGLRCCCLLKVQTVCDTHLLIQLIRQCTLQIEIYPGRKYFIQHAI